MATKKMSPQEEQYREWLERAEAEASSSIDKLLLALSSGALGLSLAFLENIVPVPQKGTQLVLYLSWFVLGGTVLINLIAQFTSMYAMRAALKELNDKGLELVKERGILDWATELLNIFSVVSLMFGMFLFVLFVAINYR